MKLSFITVDVFTSTRYAGNPLAIVEVPANQKETLTQAQKQAIAAEFNLSETVFVHLAAPDAKDTNEFIVDIFITKAEIPFAGHPTIGSAYYLLHLQQQPAEAVITKAGRIPISIDPVSKIVKASTPHDFHVHEITFTSQLTGKPSPCVAIVKGMNFILVPLPDLPALAHAVENLCADSYNTSVLDAGWQTSGIIGTMYYVFQGVDEAGNKMYRTRMHGMSTEDPGTGSASCALGSWLALQESTHEGKGPFRYAFTQGVEMGRRNEIAVEVVRDEKGTGIESVVLSGTAVKVMEGNLEV